MSDQRNFDWGNLYKTTRVTDMPWYNPNLDIDLQDELDLSGIKSGTFLDIGTGPATQAHRLQERGFRVSGIDVAEDAILLAREAYKNIEFIQDDILATKLTDKFDFIFDRGCFHVIDVEERETYARNVFNLLNDSGLLFLKCFSTRMPETGFGPHRISAEMIHDTFGSQFIIEKIRDTDFDINQNPNGIKALFVRMKKR